MKHAPHHILRVLAVIFMMQLLAACSSDGSNTCYWLKCPSEDLEDPATATTKCLNGQELPKYTVRLDSVNNGAAFDVGVVTYLALKIKENVLDSAQQVFEKITGDENYKNILNGMSLLFVMFYGAAIALGLVQMSQADLVIRVVKLGFIYALLASWDDFFELAASFFEAIANDLTGVMTSAITGSDIASQDVLGFIDDKVLPFLFSPKFAVTIGAISTAGTAAGPMLAMLLLSVVLAYLWSLVIGVQIFILSAIARALLYAVAPVFIIMLLFQQTKSLFDAWLKQLINFSLQPVLLVSFMAFFNGIFFNFLDNLFKEKYRVCFVPEAASGSVTKLSTWKIEYFDLVSQDNFVEVPVTQAMSVFNLFIVLILAFTMVKMNQWVVQAASQLTEGGLSFGGTMGAWQGTQQKISQGFSTGLRRAAGLAVGGKK